MDRRSPIAPWAIAAFACLPSAGAAADEPDRRLAVIIDTVDIGGPTETIIRGAAEQASRAHGFAVIEPGDPREGGLAASDLGGCVVKDSACVRALIAGRGLGQLLFFSIRTDPPGDSEEGEANEGEPGAAELTVIGRLLDGRTGELLAVDQRVCGARCQAAPALTALIGEMSSDLLRSERMQVVEPAPESTAANGPPRPDAPPPRRRLRTIELVTLASGVGALALGTTLVAIDGPRIDHGERQRDERTTATAGYVAIGAGTALIATGVLLWIIDSRGRDRALRAAGGPTADGWILGMEGRF